MRKIEPKIVKRRVYEPMEDAPKGKTKTEKVYPRISLPTTALPEAKGWKMGQKYTITLEVEMTGLNIRERNDVSEFDMDYGNSADFEVKGIDVKKEKGEKAVQKRYVDNDEDDE